MHIILHHIIFMTHNCQISIGICGGVASMRQTKARASVIFFRLRAKYLVRTFNHRLNLSQNFFWLRPRFAFFMYRHI